MAKIKKMAKKGKGKRKLSAYNKHIRKKVKAGATFMQAVRSWKGKKTKSRPKNKRKKYKQQRRNIVRSNMPRRRTRRRRSRGFGGFSVGRIGNTLKNIGLGFAIGAGTMAAINFVGDMANIPQARQIAPLAGAFSAYTAAPGLPGILAAIPLVQQSGVLGGLISGGQTAQGQGAFV